MILFSFPLIGGRGCIELHCSDRWLDQREYDILMDLLKLGHDAIVQSGFERGFSFRMRFPRHDAMLSMGTGRADLAKGEG